MTENDFEKLWFWLFWLLMIALPALEHAFPRRVEQTHWDERWTTNICFGVLNGAIASLTPAILVVLALWAQSKGVGLLNWIETPAWFAAAATVIVRSLTDYTTHVLSHKVPFLWRLHRVHHSDQCPNVSTGLRFHPVENAVTLFILAPVTLAFGLAPIAVATYAVVDGVISIFSHANLRLPKAYDRGFSRLIVTPHIHRLHHSSYQPETDSNYGSVFTIWDQLFGTFRAESLRPDAEMRFGLDEIDQAQANSFVWQITSPVLPAQLEPRTATSASPEIIPDAASR